jgi:hypothetical protein
MSGQRAKQPPRWSLNPHVSFVLAYIMPLSDVAAHDPIRTYSTPHVARFVCVYPYTKERHLGIYRVFAPTLSGIFSGVVPTN